MLLSLLLFCLQLFANTVIVKGRIKDKEGAAKAWWPVTISVDSTLNANCIGHHTVYTDSSGHYADTISCSNTIQQVFISTYDCNYQSLFHVEKPNGNNVVQSNFTICVAAPVCYAAFYMTKDSSKPKRIVAHAVANTSVGDSIKQYLWIWGDGDSTKTQAAQASHTYKQDGSYSVCLRIKTVKGCSSYACDSVEIYSKCRAKFYYTSLADSSNGYGVRTFSQQSFAPPGDGIVKRIWLWGDGTKSESKDSINATHYYNKTGTYNIALVIKTKRGCSDTARMDVPVPVNGFQCYANFVYTADSSMVYFNSSASHGGTYDSIINRQWSFGDSSYLDGNIVTPSHHYIDTGWYNTCITITTASGCTNTFCNVVRVNHQQTPGECHAAFTDTLWQQSQQGYAVKFNSSYSYAYNGDSVIYRTWHFGDGTAGYGNTIEPVHYYNQPGQYNVCLAIQSSGGCVDSICRIITIPPIQVNCRAAFSYKARGTSIQFYSADSSYAGAGDSIVHVSWSFGDSTILTGDPNPLHVYKHAGTYYVCLSIKTTSGCESTVCGWVAADSIPQTYCDATLYYDTVLTDGEGQKIQFNSNGSQPPSGDSILYRTWYFGDGAVLGGNDAQPYHYYKAGNYTVCLFIETSGGCKDSTCINLTIRPGQAQCVAAFTSYQRSDTAWFNSGNSSAALGDSIIMYKWNFGDSSTALTEISVANPVHHYAYPGTYKVCLTIYTASGCTHTTCTTIDINVSDSIACVPVFTVEKLGPGKYRFNSAGSTTAPGDQIVKRYWNFGDSSYLDGNNINPVKELPINGTYNVCLTIRTAQGCTKQYCQVLNIRDSTTDNSDWVKLLKVFPNPVAGPFKAVVWSKINNIKCEVSVVDAFGGIRRNKSVRLTEGVNILDMTATGLTTATYYLRVTTIYGSKSKLFFKL